MITLVAIICSGILCQDVVVPTKDMVAGKADDPIPMEFTEMMCRTEGQHIALDWLREESKHGGQYAGWTLQFPIKCVPGRYESPRHA